MSYQLGSSAGAQFPHAITRALTATIAPATEKMAFSIKYTGLRYTKNFIHLQSIRAFISALLHLSTFSLKSLFRQLMSFSCQIVTA
jgi:hypothetical protein